MGNRSSQTRPPQPDDFNKAAVLISPGTIITPISENSDAVVYSTQYRSPVTSTYKETREVQSVLTQSHGKYIVRPKNTLANGKVLQVKSMNPEPTKLFYVVRKQEGVDKWIDV